MHFHKNSLYNEGSLIGGSLIYIDFKYTSRTFELHTDKYDIITIIK